MLGVKEKPESSALRGGGCPRLQMGEPDGKGEASLPLCADAAGVAGSLTIEGELKGGGIRAPPQRTG